MEFTSLLSTTILAFSGFCIGFYGALSQAMIETETKIGMQKGFDQFTDDGAEYLARKYEKWKAEANKFKQDIKKGKKTEKEFKEWIEKTKRNY